MSNQLISRISVIIYAVVMIVFGVHHIIGGANMAGAVPNYVPAPVFFVYLTGIGFILAGLAFIIQKQAKLAGYLLGFMLLIIVLIVHFPQLMAATDSASRMMPMTNFMKDLALAMAAFYIGSKDAQ